MIGPVRTRQVDVGRLGLGMTKKTRSSSGSSATLAMEWNQFWGMKETVPASTAKVWTFPSGATNPICARPKTQEFISSVPGCQCGSRGPWGTALNGSVPSPVVA